MARTRTRLKSKQKSGFTIPTQKKIRSVLRKRGKEFLISCVMWLFVKISKGDKIRFLAKISRGRVRRVAKRRKSKTRKATRRKRRTTKRSKSRKSKKGRSPAQRRNDKRLGRMAKARAKKRR